jgi:hypothetical protein
MKLNLNCVGTGDGWLLDKSRHKREVSRLSQMLCF